MLPHVIYICVSRSFKSRHPVFFSFAVASKEKETPAQMLPETLEFSGWKTWVSLLFQRPLGIEDQGAIEMMRVNRNVSHGSQCPFNTIFMLLCKGMIMMSVMKRHFWVLIISVTTGRLLKDKHGPTTPLQGTGLTLLAAARLPQPCVKPLVCQTPVNSGLQPRQLRNSGCQTGNSVTTFLKCLFWETKIQWLAWRYLLGSCLINT